MALVLIGILLTFLLTPLVFKQPLQPWVENLARVPLRVWKRLRSIGQPNPVAIQPFAPMIQPEPHGGLVTTASVEANRRNTAHLFPPEEGWRNAAGVAFVTTSSSEQMLAEDYARRRRNIGSGNFPGVDPAVFGSDPSMHRNAALLDLPPIRTNGTMVGGVWD
jgi:hypothetical protein